MVSSCFGHQTTAQGANESGTCVGLLGRSTDRDRLLLGWTSRSLLENRELLECDTLGESVGTLRLLTSRGLL